MTLKYTEYDGVTEHVMETEAGTAGGTKRNVHGLAPAIVTKFTDMVTALQSMDTKLSTLDGHVDGLEGFVDGIEASLTALQGYVDGLEGFTDGLEGFVDGIEGKLDSILATTTPAGTIYDGTKNVTTAGTRVALAASQALTKGVRVRAKDTNTGLIFVGNVSTVSSTSDRLSPGEATWIDADNLAIVGLDAAVNGEGVTFSAW